MVHHSGNYKSTTKKVKGGARSASQPRRRSRRRSSATRRGRSVPRTRSEQGNAERRVEMLERRTVLNNELLDMINTIPNMRVQGIHVNEDMVNEQMDTFRDEARELDIYFGGNGLEQEVEQTRVTAISLLTIPLETFGFPARISRKRRRSILTVENNSDSNSSANSRASRNTLGS
jgi:hypothetical protein